MGGYSRNSRRVHFEEDKKPKSSASSTFRRSSRRSASPYPVSRSQSPEEELEENICSPRSYKYQTTATENNKAATPTFPNPAQVGLGIAAFGQPFFAPYVGAAAGPILTYPVQLQNPSSPNGSQVHKIGRAIASPGDPMILQPMMYRLQPIPVGLPIVTPPQPVMQQPVPYPHMQYMMQQQPATVQAGGSVAQPQPIYMAGQQSYMATPVQSPVFRPPQQQQQQLNNGHINKADEPQDFKPADPDPSRMYHVRELDGNWTMQTRFAIDNQPNCRWYVTDQGVFYGVRLSQ